MKKFLKENLTEERAKRTKYEAKIVTRACIMMRSLATKINFIANSFFYDDTDRKKIIFDYCSGFRLFRIRFDASQTSRSVLEMKFNFHNIYSTHIITRMSTIIPINDAKIKQLINFTDQLIIKMNAYMNNIHENILTEYFDNLIRINEENKGKIIDLKQAKKDLINEMNDFDGPTREALIKDKYSFFGKKRHRYNLYTSFRHCI
ncbi:hypothetical protein BDAP_002083 [Binucleata daphniae]